MTTETTTQPEDSVFDVMITAATSGALLAIIEVEAPPATSPQAVARTGLDGWLMWWREEQEHRAAVARGESWGGSTDYPTWAGLPASGVPEGGLHASFGGTTATADEAYAAEAHTTNELVFRLRSDRRSPPITSADLLGPVAVGLFLPIPQAPEPPRPAARPHSTRKVTVPWSKTSLYRVPNVHNHGTRHLGRTVAGAVALEVAPSGEAQALIGGVPAATIDLTDPGEGLARLQRLLNPRAIKTLVATSRLIWEKANGQPHNRAVPLTVPEIAIAMGYTRGKDRKLDREVTYGVARDLIILSKVHTWAAEGTWNTKTHAYAAGQLTPMLIITAIRFDEADPETGMRVAYEFDGMLGSNWAEAMRRGDVVQIPPGFLKLSEGGEILLGWFYITQFRYQMTKQRTGVTRTIRALCEEAGIDPGRSDHRGRFLQRLHRWHERLQQHGVIGGYERRPPIEADLAPSVIFQQGEYMATPPPALLTAYQEERDKAHARNAKQAPQRGNKR
jgi:hypothetical protein